MISAKFRRPMLVVSLSLFLVWAGLLSYYLLLLHQSRRFSIDTHALRLPPGPFLGLALAIFLFLVAFWHIFSRGIAKYFKISAFEVLKRDIWSFFPLFFLLLLPLLNRYYLDRGDYQTRLRLLGFAVFGAIIDLKLVNILRIRKDSLPFTKKVLDTLVRLTLPKRMIILFLAALIVFNLGSFLMLKGGIFLHGDEPHYLLLTHSLLNDGDFDLSNNYASRDYLKFMPPYLPLRPHIAPRTQNRYSFHSPGLAVLMLPFYALGHPLEGQALIFVVRFGMSLFGALFGVQVYLLALQWWKNPNLALRLWGLFCFTVPIFFYALHLYPEIIAALLSLTIFRLLKFSRNITQSRCLLLGGLLFLLLWLHAVKYTFILIPLFMYAVWTLWKKHEVGWNILYFLVLPFLLTALHSFYSLTLYGSLSPFSVSLTGSTSTAETIALSKAIFTGIPFHLRWETLADYFFDQRDGLLLYAPVYGLAFLGAFEFAKRNIKSFVLVLVLSAPYVLNLAFLTQRPAYSPQARTLVAVFWAPVLFMGYFLVRNRTRLLAWIFRLLFFLSIVQVVLLLQSPWSLYQPTTAGELERSGKIFMELSNLYWYWPQYLPSFLKVDNAGWIPNYVWLAGFILFLLAYFPLKKIKIKPRFGLHMGGVFFGLLVFFFVFVLYPRPVLRHPAGINFPSGEKIIFYDFGQEARMVDPGRFHLPRDNRAYVFYFASWRPLQNLRLDFGSSTGTFEVQVDYFDRQLYRKKITGKVESLNVAFPVPYRFRQLNLYRISLFLVQESGPSMREQPFVLSILPSS